MTPTKYILPILLLAPLCASAQAQPTWTQKSPPFPVPAGRLLHAMAYDAARSQIVMFGGYSMEQASSNDTWVWDGSAWSQKIPRGNIPRSRYGHAMVFDSAHGQILLFGGYFGIDTGGFTRLGDTWVWDGAAWTQKLPQTSPLARSGHAMAYDSAHGQVVLFGGYNGSYFGDTWVWDGATWTQKSPPGSPSARTYHTMVYDSTRGQVVLFGGVDANSTKLSDTWLWDGANWTQYQGAAAPPARQWHMMAFDTAHHEVVLFGGLSATFSVLGDTWVFDGSTWTVQNPAGASPAARFVAAMDFDVARGQVVLFGGSADPSLLVTSPDFHDTWVWNGVSPVNLPVIAGVQSAGAFGAFTTVSPGTWVEIYGSNLSSTSRQWMASDFSGSNAPTKLDAVSVTINNQPAFLDFIRADQVNAQLPSNISPGPAQIILTNGNVSSAPFSITVNTVQPGLLAPPSFKVNGLQYVVAQLVDGTYILPTGAIPGINSRQAKPGEAIVIYGIGFGSVTPNIPAGVIVSQSNQLALPFQMSFGSTPAQLQYFGLAPNYVGLYQFNVVVPEIADSDLVPLTFTLNGIPGSQTLYTAVHH